MFCFSTWRSVSNNYFQVLKLECTFSGFYRQELDLFHGLSQFCCGVLEHILFYHLRGETALVMVLLMVMMMMLARLIKGPKVNKMFFHLPDELVLLLRQLSLHILGPASLPGIFMFAIVIIL